VKSRLRKVVKKRLVKAVGELSHYFFGASMRFMMEQVQFAAYGGSMNDSRHLFDKAKIMHFNAKEARDRGRPECRTHVDAYNELLDETEQICGDEVYQYMSHIEPLRRVSAYPIENEMDCLSNAVNKLSELMVYLQRERQK